MEETRFKIKSSCKDDSKGSRKDNSTIGKCLYCSVPDDKYEEFRKDCREYLKTSPEIPVHLYLDQDIVACHGVDNYWEIKRETANSTDAKNEVREIRRRTLDHIVSENIHCGLNVIVLGTDSFWGETVDEKNDWRTACNLAKKIKEEIIDKGKDASPPAVTGDRLRMRDGTPMVVMVAGCPGSGKSTVGKRISRELKVAFIDKDTVAREISEKTIEVQKSYEGDYETNAYGKSIRTAQYKDMGLIASVNLKLNRSVLITAPFNSQVDRLITDKSIDELYLDPNVPESMKWPKDGKIGLYFVWVETSRETELSRLFARDAKRDSWKLTHWISHARKQNDSHVRTRLKCLSQIGHSIFCNEYDDDMDFEVETTVKKINAFCRSRSACKFPVASGRGDETGAGKDDFARAIKGIVGKNKRLDCYCADFEPLKRNGVERYRKVCNLRKGVSGKFYYVDVEHGKENDGMPYPLVVRDKTIDKKVDMDYLRTILHVKEDGQLINEKGEPIVDDGIPNSNLCRQLIFERCTFQRAVALKKLKFDIAFNNCRFEDSMLIFNRKDTVFATKPCGNSSRNAILIFRCTALDDCMISEASADVSIVDSELRDVRLNHVEFDRMSIYGSTMNTLEVSANCAVGKEEDGCCFWLRDTRIQDVVLLPNVSFDRMNLNGSIINRVRFSKKTLDGLGDSMKAFWRHGRDVGDDVRGSLGNPNELIRRSYVVNTLYTSLSACNYYKQADECLWHARKLGYRLSQCGSKCPRKFWEWVKYTVAYRFFGGGIKLLPLLANYFISTVVLGVLLYGVANRLGIVCLLSKWRQLDCETLANAFRWVELCDMIYLAGISILNINQSLLGCTGLLGQIDAGSWPIVLVMTMGNAYGLALLAVFMAAIVRKMVR